MDFLIFFDLEGCGGEEERDFAEHGVAQRKHWGLGARGGDRPHPARDRQLSFDSQFGATVHRPTFRIVSAVLRILRDGFTFAAAFGAQTA